MTRAGALATATVERIVTRFALTEKGDPFLALPAKTPGSDGVCRLWSGDAVERLVYVGLSFPPAGLDSHMLFAFTPGASAVPHFTLDSVVAGPHHAFHLDLIPRVDLGANLAYMDEVLTPLDEAYAAGRAIEGLSQAQLSPRQLALMSPWMLAFRATQDAFDQIGVAVDAYLDHWTKLLDNGIACEVDEAALAARDRANRAALFNPDVDPVWNQIAPLIGDEAGARIRALLKGEE